MNLKEACEKAVAGGKAIKVSETAILFVGEIDEKKFQKFREDYDREFDKRVEERDRKEREAMKKMRDYLITF